MLRLFVKANDGNCRDEAFSRLKKGLTLALKRPYRLNHLTLSWSLPWESRKEEMRRIPIRLQGLTQSPYCTTPLEKHTLFSNLNKHLFSLGQIAPLIGKSYFCFEGSCRAPNKRRNCSLSCQCHPLTVLT